MKNKINALFVVAAVLLIYCQCTAVLPDAEAGNAVQLPEEGDSLLSAGEYDEAVISYSNFLKEYPESAYAYYARGKSYFLSGSYVKAVDDFDTCIMLDNQNIDAYFFRAWAHVANGAIERAKSDFDVVIERKPELLQAYVGRQWCYMNLAQWSQSSVLYLYQKFESDAGLTEAYEDRNWYFVKQMQWEISSPPVPAQAFNSSVDEADVFCNRGFTFFKKAQWDVVKRDLENAYNKDPGLNRSNWNIDWAIGKYNEWDYVIDDNNRIIDMIGSTPLNRAGNGGDALEWKAAAISCYQKVENLSVDQEVSQKAASAIDFINMWSGEVGLLK